MPVKKDEQGRRYVEATVEVPGTPDEVWRAIATSTGISSWFVPTTSDERAGGRTVSSFGPGMDAVGTIRTWDPPRSYSTESEEGPGTVATEWIVEARAGGTCIVRVVHRWFADSDEWDGEFEGHAYGWAASFFRILKIYLTHFSGEECAAFDLSAFSQAPPAETWRMFTRAMDIDPTTGRVASTPGTPELTGNVENQEITDPALLSVRQRAPQIVAALEGMDGVEPELLLRLDRPAPGVAHAFAMRMGEQTLLSLRFFLFGPRGAAVAPDAQRAWSDWLAEQDSVKA